MLRTLGIGSTIFFAVVMQTFALTGAIADAQPPEGVNEVTVHCPNEVSGVAAAESGFVVVGDGEPLILRHDRDDAVRIPVSDALLIARSGDGERRKEERSYDEPFRGHGSHPLETTSRLRR